MTAIDLFSGCGGLTEGLKQAGFSVLAGAELRSEARRAYSLNHPEVVLFDDVRTLTKARLDEHYDIEVGELDLLAACPPCQGFSSLRTKNRKPAEDERNKLIFQVSRLAEELYPKAVLVENVPGLLTDWRMAEFRRRLRKMGYSTMQGVLDASDFGVPQRRRRMILIGIRGKLVPTLPAPTTQEPQTVRSVLQELSPDQKTASTLHQMRQKLSKTVLDRIADIPKDGGSRRHLGISRQLECHIQKKGEKPRGFSDVYGRLSWDKVASTITRFCHNPSKGRFLHPEHDRGLTVYEAMLLQGFPSSYELPTDIGIVKLASLIGEAFPPPFASGQASHIRELLKQCSNEPQFKRIGTITRKSRSPGPNF